MWGTSMSQEVVDKRLSVTITFLIEKEGKFLLIKRPSTESNYPDLWAFTGGRLEFGETLSQALTREVREETGLELTDEVAFLDSYFFSSKSNPNKGTLGIAVLVRCKDGDLVPFEYEEYAWISNLEELKCYEHIRGIEYHMKRALEVLKNPYFYNIELLNLTEDKYE